MTFGKAIIFCFVISFVVHYGWRMRGTVVGGEKGAMLPGMLAGLFIALFGGGGLREYFYIPAAAGLIGMSYGGIEPYGDSIAMIMSPQTVKPNPKKGYFGLAVKGALWFSIAGGFIGISISAMGGKYKVTDAVLFPILIFAFQALGYKFFNSPYDKEKEIYPPVYLSFESRDEWGSNIGVLTAIIVLAVLNKDTLPLIIAACGLFFGAIGWLIAMKLYYYTEHPLKNGKYLFGILSKKKLVGGWGNMELCLGSFGGLGLALGVVIGFKEIERVNNIIETNGISSLLSNDIFSIIAVISCFAGVLVINIVEYQMDKRGKNYNGFIMDLIERPFFNTLPFVLVMLCSLSASKLLTAFTLIYMLFIKNAFDRFKPEQPRIQFIIVSTLITVLMFIYTVFFKSFSPFMLVLSATVPYIVAEIVWNGTNRKYGGWKRVFSINGFSFNILLLCIQSLILFLILFLI